MAILYAGYIILLTISTFLSLTLYAMYEDHLFAKALIIKDIGICLFFFFGITIPLCKQTHRLVGHLSTIYVMSAAFVIVNLVSFLASGADLTMRLFNLRRHLLLILTFVAFSLIPLQRDGISLVEKTIRLVAWVSIVFGLVEVGLPDEFWDITMNLPGFWEATGVDPFVTKTIAESGRFYSYDLATLTGEPQRRLVSLYLEPTTLAAFLSFCLVYFALKGQSSPANRLLIGGLLIAGLLTMSKAFLLAVFVVVWVRLSHILPPATSLLLSTGGMYGVGALFNELQLSSGPFSHIHGLYTGINYFLTEEPFGLGLGNGGNYAALIDANMDAGGYESGLGSMLVQIGVGGLLFVGIIYAIMNRLHAEYRNTGHKTYLALASAIFVWYLSFLLSASSLGFSGNVFGFLAAGLWLNQTALRGSR